jgi:hypothetical protein
LSIWSQMLRASSLRASCASCGSRDVVVLAGRDGDLDRQPKAIGQSMDFRSKTAPASSHTSIRVAFFKVAAEWWTRTLVPSIIRTSPS